MNFHQQIDRAERYNLLRERIRAEKSEPVRANPLIVAPLLIAVALLAGHMWVILAPFN